MADQPDDAARVLRAVWAVDGPAAEDAGRRLRPDQGLQEHEGRDASTGSPSRAATYAPPGARSWRARASSATPGSACATWSSARGADLTQPGDGAAADPSATDRDPARRRLSGRPRAVDRAVRRALARPADPARGRGRRRQDRGRQGAGAGVRAPADPAAVLRGHRHQPGALRVGLRAADAADPRPVRAAARPTTTRSTSCSARSSCSSGRCCEAVRAGDQAVLLIDEVDRADDEFEAFLLELLSDFQITIPEIGTIVAETAPLVVLTSNRTRELHDALKRRCLYHWVGYPSAEREVEIVLVREPGVSEALARKVVAAVHRLRELDLAKPPGRGRDDRLGAHARRARRRPTSTPATVDDTLGAVVKDRDDLELVRANLERDRHRCLTLAAPFVATARRLRPRAARRGVAVGSGDIADLLRGDGPAGPRRPGRPVLGRPHHPGQPARPDLRSTTGFPARSSSASRGRCPSRRGRSACSARERGPGRAAGAGDRARRAGARRARGRLGLLASDADDAAGKVVRRLHARGAGRRCGRSCARSGSRRRAGGPGAPCAGPAGRRPDLRRTVRETMRAHGEPAELFWRRRRLRLRPLILILDVSGLDGRLLAEPAPVRATPPGGRRPGSRCSASAPG